MKNYIVVNECSILNECEILARCDKLHVKQTYDFNKRMYPNVNIKVYREVVL